MSKIYGYWDLVDERDDWEYHHMLYEWVEIDEFGKTRRTGRFRNKKTVIKKEKK